MSAFTIWLAGLVRRRYGRILPAVLGVSLTIALLAILGIFINASAATMTRRALGDVPVDWQAEIAAGADAAEVEKALRETARVQTVDPVGYADVSGFTSHTEGTTQTTGEGKVLGIPPGYWNDFPAQVRPMLGATDGILIAQQTAANLHASVGDTVIVTRIGLPPVKAVIDGVIDLPQADALFQAVEFRPERHRRRLPTTSWSFRWMSGTSGSTSRRSRTSERFARSCTCGWITAACHPIRAMRT